jgi:hypothetical protein
VTAAGRICAKVEARTDSATAMHNCRCFDSASLSLNMTKLSGLPAPLRLLCRASITLRGLGGGDHRNNREENQLECPANFVPVGMRQTGMRGAWNGTRKEAFSRADREPASAD